MPARVRGLVPMIHVKDVARSVAFYEHLGFQVGNTFTPPGTETLAWAWLEMGVAHLMLTRADGAVVPEQQAVLFYLYFEDVAATRETLLAEGLQPGEISYPFFAPRGQFRLEDPDGYVLMLMHT